MQIVVVFLAVVAMVFAFLYWRRDASLAELQAQFVDMRRLQEESRVIAAQGTLETGQRIVELRQSLDNATAIALESLEWAANQASRYDFDELPMGDSRLEIIDKLTNQLRGLGFRGVVQIESHVGNYCMAFSGLDGYTIAPPDLPVTRCDQIGFEPGEAYEMGLRQSVAFANFMYRARGITGGAIRYEITSSGNDTPLVDYPLLPSGLTASAWNDIAASNNRVEISLFPDRE
jgi:hypothetical protein